MWGRLESLPHMSNICEICQRFPFPITFNLDRSKSGACRLKVMDEAEIVALPLGAHLGCGFKIYVNKEMGILRPMEDEAGTNSKDLFLASGDIPAVHLGIGGLFQIVSVHPRVEPLLEDFIRAGEIKMDSLSSEGAARSSAIRVDIRPIGIVVSRIPEVMDAG
jgi:hypothetical protein